MEKQSLNLILQWAAHHLLLFHLCKPLVAVAVLLCVVIGLFSAAARAFGVPAIGIILPRSRVALATMHYLMVWGLSMAFLPLAASALAGAAAGVGALALDASPVVAYVLCVAATLALRAGSLLFGWRLPTYRSRPPRP